MQVSYPAQCTAVDAVKRKSRVLGVCQAMQSLRSIIRANQGVEIACKGSFRQSHPIPPHHSNITMLTHTALSQAVVCAAQPQGGACPHAGFYFFLLLQSFYLFIYLFFLFIYLLFITFNLFIYF